MASQHTAEEVELQYIRAMGADLGPLFYCLWNECSHLHWKWNEYVVLFGSKPERLGLLNEAASSFFWIVQSVMWEDVLLHISRLVDPPKSAGKSNLTLGQLPQMVDSSIRKDLERLLVIAREQSEFARDWRMRHIAHRDLSLALQEGVSPLAPASRAAVKAALTAIDAVLNAVESHYSDATVAYEHFRAPDGAEALLYVLDGGLATEKAFQERLKSGNLLPEDCAPKTAL